MSHPLPAAEFPATIVKLSNGLTVIHQYLPGIPVVVTDVWVRAGAIVEPEAWSGMAHFLEHMIFKGTEQILPGVFDQVIEARGGVSNAATSHDYAHYFITTANEYLEDTLPYLADLILHAAIPEDEFIRERDVVLEEIRQSYDDPDAIGFQALAETIFSPHPYGRSVLGTEATLIQQSPETMRCFHRAHYQPEKMTVVMIGGVPQEEALTAIHHAFRDFSSRSICPQPSKEPKLPLQEIRRQELYLPRLEQARLMMAWVCPGISGGNSWEQLRTACGLDLLSILLAGGRTSRLVQELREERQLVHDIDSHFSLQRDSSLFTITALLEPENLDRVEAIVCDRLSQLATLPISNQELSRCKRLLCNDFIFSTELPCQLAGLYGYYSTIAQVELSVTYPDLIPTIQPHQLQPLASHYLSPYRYGVTILKPA